MSGDFWQRILFGVKRVLRFVIRTFLFHDGKGVVQIHTVFGNVHNAYGDVGAVVCRPLQTGEQIQPNKAGFYGADSLFETQDMGVSHGFLQIVNDLSQRLYVS